MRIEYSNEALTPECISLSEAKLWAKVDITTLDTLITDELIPAARKYAEAYIQGAILPQNVTVWFNAYDTFYGSRAGEMYWRQGSRYINLGAYGIPVRVGDFRIFDDAGNPTVWNPNNYSLSGNRILLNDFLPYELRDEDAFSISYVAGFGMYDEDANTWTEAVPQDIKIALKMIITHWIQNPQVMGQDTMLPFGATAILDRYKTYAL